MGGVIACSNGSDSDGGDDKKDVVDDKTPELTSTITFDDDEKVVLEASEIPENVDSITITVTGVTGTSTDSWWFWAKTDSDKGDDIKWKTGSAAEAIYEVTITDTAKIQYLKEKGIAIKGAKGLTAKVTVSVTEKQSEQKPDPTPPNDDGNGDDADDSNKGAGDEDSDTTGGEQTTLPTLPTEVVLNSKIDGTSWAEKTMTKSATDGIWTCNLTLSNRWPNFNVKATFGENDVWYKGSEIKLGEASTIIKDGSDDIWCNVGEKYNGAQILVTVDFTGTKPSIEIKLVKEGTTDALDNNNGQTTTLPTVVVLGNKIDGSNWTETTMTKSETDGIWTCDLTLSNQWPNFNVKATFGDNDAWYKGGEIKLDESSTIIKDGSDNIWCNVGADKANAKILVTVDFTTVEKPTIKIETVE